jgi:hypothetical protein
MAAAPFLLDSDDGPPVLAPLTADAASPSPVIEGTTKFSVRVGVLPTSPIIAPVCSLARCS